MQPISFCINTSRNELEYIKLLFKSLKDNLKSDQHEIIIFIDSDNENTFEWLLEQKSQFKDLKILKNILPVCYGYARNIKEFIGKIDDGNVEIEDRMGRIDSDETNIDWEIDWDFTNESFGDEGIDYDDIEIKI